MKARSANPDAHYHDVSFDPAKLEEMLKVNGGARKVPTIVKDGEVIIGYEGGT